MALDLITGLSEIAGRYDALVCDIWGVVHDGRSPHPAAAEALRQFRKRYGKVVLLSNAPRTPDSVVAQLEVIGVDLDCFDAIVTSGGAARERLAAWGGTPALYYIGPEKDAGLLDGVPHRRTSLEEADVALCTGLVDDLTQTPADYSAILSAMREKSLPMLCANPDLKVYRGPKLCWCAGAIAADYEKLGGTVTYFGKPHAEIYEVARKAAGNPKKPLMIGDAIRTDLKGAAVGGMEALFIADGLHGEEIEPYTQAHLEELFAAEKTTAVAAMRALTW